MLDGYGRKVTELRVSVTPKCNLRCFFCHKEWDFSEEETSTQELSRILKVAASCGIRRLKITGGEPLLREDLPAIVRQASASLDEVSITTNGTFLSELASDLKKAGLSRVNINLPTLDPRRYAKICGADLLEDVTDGIRAAIEHGFPTKINFVVLKGINEDEVSAIMDFARSTGAVLQLIELQPIPSDGGIFERYHVDLSSMEEELRSMALSVEATRGGQRNRYVVRHNGGDVKVEVVRPTGNPSFCSLCSKLRMTSDGKLKPCLLRSDNLVDIVNLLRSGATDEELAQRFRLAVANREPYWKASEQK